VTDFLEEKHMQITDRLKELKPAVDEYSRLEAAASALAKLGRSAPTTITTTTNSAPRRRGPGRPRRSAKAVRSEAAPAAGPVAAPTATPVKAARKKPGRPPGRKKVGRPAGRPKGRVGRRKGSGTRALEALSFVQGQPGITIPELAGKMGIKQNYLYRVLPGLEQESKLEKKGRGWYPKAS
jgi:hypothetical protein